MAAKKPSPIKKTLDKKSERASKLYDQFIEAIVNKKAAVSTAASEAKSSLKTIKGIEKRGQDYLVKAEASTTKQLGSIQQGLAQAASKTKTSISTAYEEVDQIRDDTRKAYRRFKVTHDAALNGERGINARRDDIVSRHEKVKTVHGQINQLNSEVQEQAAEIKVAHSDSLADRNSVGDIKTRAEEIKTEIEKTYHITIDSALGGALNTRKGEIRKMMYVWLWLFISAVITLLVTVGYFILHPPGGGLVEAFGNRLVYLTPLLFVIFVFYKQFSHERRLLEEYAFKSVMAQTLRNYAVLLSGNYDNVEGGKGKILTFLLNSMTDIYDRSSIDKNTGFFYQLIVGHKNAGAQATFQEGTTEIQKTSSEKIKATVEGGDKN